ncbi:response regulator [Pseudodesulfovibrio sp. zrk46]|uniref:response regulator n=1 Tax=Pseudodesulfovibrio sp. zrk46 TaxID=2725288 RepID=UPI0014494954|nr:response regulator [Pseudodesulfovibrio sp. zrk46]QJB56804.1 response regulator [Pseudodesulfovibrio sp. zrk46]
MSKKILIIDDDPAIVEFLEEFFQDNDFETVTAFNGTEGLEKVKAETPDLITLDMDMPEKGGTLFYAGLRKEESLRDTPVIVISGVGPRPPALSKDVPVLTKPVEHADLLKEVQAILG